MSNVDRAIRHSHMESTLIFFFSLPIAARGPRPRLLITVWQCEDRAPLCKRSGRQVLFTDAASWLGGARSLGVCCQRRQTKETLMLCESREVEASIRGHSRHSIAGTESSSSVVMGFHMLDRSGTFFSFAVS